MRSGTQTFVQDEYISAANAAAGSSSESAEGAEKLLAALEWAVWIEHIHMHTTSS